jgi:hypothetical protein
MGWYRKMSIQAPSMIFSFFFYSEFLNFGYSVSRRSTARALEVLEVPFV